MSSDAVLSEIFIREEAEWPKKVVLIKMRSDFYEKVAASRLSNGNFAVSATGPTSVVGLFCGVPFEIHEQSDEFELELK
ncbi:hypothetical protein D3C86_1982980 [compost metagenome]